MTPQTRGPETVLSKKTSRSSGRDARTMNLTAGKAVAEAIRTTLGPRGMDKMLLDSSGNVVVTNDGVTLLEEMDITHPAADLVVEVAQTQESEVGDGTTSAVILAGELLSNVEELIDDGVHPTTVVAGYRHAAQIAREELESLAVDIDTDDRAMLEQIAATAMTGKGAEQERDLLAGLVVDAVLTATREDGTVDRDSVYIRTFPGKSLGDSEFFEGTVVGQSPPHPDMPTSFEDASVLVYERPIELSEPELDIEATITNEDQITAFNDRDRAELDAVVDPIIESGADIVLVDGAIDDRAQQRFADADVLALRRVDDDNRRRVADATGAERVGSLEDLTADDLGAAGRVHRMKIRAYTHKPNSLSEHVLVFDDVDDSTVGTIFLRGGTDHVLDEVERAIEDSIGVVTSAIENGQVLPGGGATEIELSLAVREAASSFGGREQLAVEAFADALEVGPRTLAENAGHDTIDTIVDLIASHDAGNHSDGLDADSGQPVDALAAGIIEPLTVRSTAITSAVDAAAMLLRIDGVVSAGDLSTAGADDK